MEQTLSSYVKTADWKAEKHVPVLAVPAVVTAGQPFAVEVAVGKEIPHPNTVEHHIAWIALHFVPDGAPVSVEIGRVDLSSHGPDVATGASTTFAVQLRTSGTFHATAYCNLHGLWTSSARVEV